MITLDQEEAVTPIKEPQVHECDKLKFSRLSTASTEITEDSLHELRVTEWRLKTRFSFAKEESKVAQSVNAEEKAVFELKNVEIEPAKPKPR